MDEQVIGEVLSVIGAGYYDRDTVTSVQQALKERSFDPVKIDGIYGPNTASAIERFQAASNVKVTGAIDDSLLTQLGLGKLPPSVPAPVDPSKPTLPTTPPAGVSPVSFWSKPIVGNIKIWQGALGLAALLALGIGASLAFGGKQESYRRW